MKYGVTYGDGPGTQVERCAGCIEAHRRAIDLAVSGRAADVVELENVEPVSSDGEILAELPAPKRTITQYSVEDGLAWAAGDTL